MLTPNGQAAKTKTAEANVQFIPLSASVRRPENAMVPDFRSATVRVRKFPTDERGGLPAQTRDCITLGTNCTYPSTTQLKRDTLVRDDSGPLRNGRHTSITVAVSRELC